MQKAIIIAHRGASGYRPEHTLASYRLAIEMGADFIEPDLVFTRDGHLIARHENELSGTTDVAQRPEFAARYCTKFIDGVATRGWFSEDFTLAEIKTLRARERIPATRPQNTLYDGQFEIPTLAEIIQLAQSAEKEYGRKVGIYPETKHPTYFAYEGRYQTGEAIHRCLNQALLQELIRHQFTDPRRVYIQSFEVENLLELRYQQMPRLGLSFPLVQLLGDLDLQFPPEQSNFSRPYDFYYHSHQKSDLDAIYGELNRLLQINPQTHYGDLVQHTGLTWLAQHCADAIGPWKNSLFDEDGGVRPFIPHAQTLGLAIHPYTVRVEDEFLLKDSTGKKLSVEEEIEALLELQVDGFFIDQSDVGRRVRDAYYLARQRRQA